MRLITVQCQKKPGIRIQYFRAELFVRKMLFIIQSHIFRLVLSGKGCIESAPGQIH